MLSVASRRTLVTATDRLSSLRKLINDRPMVRALEVHNGLTALIAETAHVDTPSGKRSFDATWSSSLTSSASKGKPDIETVDTTERLQIVTDALEVTSKPMIYDGDTGGLPEVFHFTVRKLERLGVSMCIIEDKTGLKQNSLFGTDRTQTLADVDEFCHKLRVGKSAQVTNDFMITARIEALIAGAGEEEALRRARRYIDDGGVDAIMIHSKEKDPREIISFLHNYHKQQGKKVPVVVVPTTYNVITEDELAEHGASVCIYANHLLRAAYPSMMQVAKSILANQRSKETDDIILPVREIITLIDDNTGSKE